MYGLKFFQRYNGELRSRMASGLELFKQCKEKEPAGPAWTPRKWHKSKSNSGFHCYPANILPSDLVALDSGGMKYTTVDCELWLVESFMGNVNCGVHSGLFLRPIKRILSYTDQSEPFRWKCMREGELGRWREENIFGASIRISGKWVDVYHGFGDPRLARVAKRKDLCTV